MTVRTAGVEVPKIKVAGVDALRVMVGTGASAVEAWPGFINVAMDFNFPNQEELKWAPVTGFDSRTSSTSALTPAFTYLDQLVAGDNSVDTYYTRLIDQQLDGETNTFTVTMGDTMNTVARPSYLVLASNLIFTNMLVLEYGNNGLRLFTLVNGVTSTPYTNSGTLSSGDRMKVVVDKDRVSVYKNESVVAFASWVIGSVLAQFRGVNGRMYPGFGMYSTNGQWSTRMQRLQIEGKTSYKRVLVASEALPRIEIPNNVWTEVARSVIPTGGRTGVSLVGATWNYASSSGNRQFRIKVDGLHMGTTADEGGSLSFSALDLFDNSVVTVEAISASTNAAYRRITGGVLQIGDPSLPV